MIRVAWAAWLIITGQIVTLWTSALTYWRLRFLGAEVGPRLQVRGWIDIHIHRNAKVSIGSDCRFKSGFAENPVGGFRRMGIWVAKGGNLRIGSRVGISNSTIVCANSITIEDDV